MNAQAILLSDSQYSNVATGDIIGSMRNLFLCCLPALACLLPVFARGLPQIDHLSGNSQHNQSIQITGSGFGSHAGFGGQSHAIGTHLASVWKDMEDCLLSSDGLAPMYYENQWSVQQSGGKANSACHARKTFIEDRRGPLGRNMNYWTGEVFTSFYFKVPDQWCGSKFFRIWGESTNIYLASGCEDYMIRGAPEYCECSPAPGTQWASPQSLQAEEWQRVDVYLRDSPGNHEFTVWLDNRLQWTKRADCSGVPNCEAEQWVENPFGGLGHSIDYGHMICDNTSTYAGCQFGSSTSPAADRYYEFDDIYLTYTRAHIELCDRGSWTEVSAGGADCEIQIPLSWSDASINFTVNHGRFSAGSRVYLYVVNSSGEVNSLGYELQLGSQPVDTLAPGAPGALRITDAP